jgi:hypothetical protein
MTTAQAPSATADSPARVVLQETADVLYASARQHKAAERSHRRQARDAMRTLDRLQKMCADLGIKLVVTRP